MRLPLVALFGLPSVHLGRVAGVATLSRRNRNAEPSNGLFILGTAFTTEKITHVRQADGLSAAPYLQ